MERRKHCLMAHAIGASVGMVSTQTMLASPWLHTRCRAKDPAAQPYFSMKIEESDDEWATARYFRHDFFLLFNLAVGGSYTRIWEPEKITAVPAGVDVNMYVDYVKVYQKQK